MIAEGAEVGRGSGAGVDEGVGVGCDDQVSAGGYITGADPTAAVGRRHAGLQCCGVKPVVLFARRCWGQRLNNLVPAPEAQAQGFGAKPRLAQSAGGGRVGC